MLVGLVIAAGTAVVLPIGPPDRAAADVWSAAPFPADFRSEVASDPAADIDDLARSFADVDHPGPIVGLNGCGAVDLLDGSVHPYELFDGETMPARWTSARLCRVDGDELILELDGETTNADGTVVVGSAHARFVRGDASLPFVRVAIDLTDGRCFSIAPSDGLYANGSPAQTYLLQGWNFTGDPGVDCSSRQAATTTSTTSTTVVDETSTSTTSTTAPSSSSTSTTTTTTTRPAGTVPAMEPAAAVPVAGTVSYTG